MLASKVFSAAAARRGLSREVSIASAATKALCMAMKTPVENTGSMNAKASPSIR
ncbi:hypothetical protein D3C83_130270 [compost metagenome]